MTGLAPIPSADATAASPHFGQVGGARRGGTLLHSVSRYFHATMRCFGVDFGASVAIDGDWLVVGSPGDAPAGATDSNYGAVYVFQRSGTGGVWIQTQKITAEDPAADSYFGTSLAIQGNRFLVGAPGAEGADTGVTGLDESRECLALSVHKDDVVMRARWHYPQFCAETPHTNLPSGSWPEAKTG